MSKKKNNRAPIIFTASDFWVLVKEKWTVALVVAVVASGLIGHRVLKSQVTYTATGSFLDGGIKSPSMGGGFSELLGLGNANSSVGKVYEIIQSRKLLAPLVEKLNLQAQVSPLPGNNGGFLSNAKRVLCAELSHFRNWPVYEIEEVYSPITCTDISYSEELSRTGEIFFEDESTFSYYDKKKKVSKKGAIDAPFEFAGTQFTLRKEEGTQVSGQKFSLTLFPLPDVVTALGSSISLENSDHSDEILHIELKHGNRKRACFLANQVIQAYSDYLKEQNEQVFSSQIDYLERKQNESYKDLKLTLEEHSNVIKENIANTGYLKTENEAQHLVRTLQKLRTKVEETKLEIQRISSISSVGDLLKGGALPKTSFKGAENLLARYQGLRKERDSLELALKHHETTLKDGQEELFHQYDDEIDEIDNSIEEAELILTSLVEHKPLPTNLKLINSDNTVASLWVKQLDKSASAGPKSKSYDVKLRRFKEYLKNFLRISKMRRDLIQERLSHQKQVEKDFEGLSLESTKKLYFSYNDKLDAIQDDVIQYQYVLDQLQNPEVEVSPLTSHLSDPVSSNSLRSILDMSLKLREQENRSAKEKERIQSEIDFQRDFLNLHLVQSISLKGLSEKITREKIQSLQERSLELINQETALIKKSLEDEIESYSKSLLDEKDLLLRQITETQEQSLLLPKKWISEQELEAKKQNHQTMVKKLAELINTKSVTHNLEVVESGPLDLALSPLKPDRPKLFLKMILGALAAFIGTFSFFFFHKILMGFAATAENLRLSSQHVSGTLSSNVQGSQLLSGLSVEDRNTFRELSSHISLQDKGVAYLINNNTSNYSFQLAKILSKKGLKTLLISCPVEHDGEPAGETGLLDFLSEEVDTLPIQKSAGFDFVPSGGDSLYAPEYLMSERFTNTLESLREDYDWILLSHSISSKDALSAGVHTHAEVVAVSLNGETIQDLEPYIVESNDPESKPRFTFIFRKDS